MSRSELKKIDRSRKGPLIPMLAPVLALLCSLLLLCLPVAGARMQDALLFSRVLPRPLEENALEERAREIPLVYALYRRRYLIGSGYSDAVLDDGTGNGTQLLRDKTSELEKAGVLDEATARQIQDFLETLPAQTACSTSGDFAAAYQECRPERAWGSSMTLYWHSEKGPVVSFRAPVDASQIRPKELLRQYRAYLGVDALGDWEEAGPADDTQSACWSRAGQLYLYCYAKKTELIFGAASLCADEIPETVLQ